MRNLSISLVARGHSVEVITIATDGAQGAALDEGVRLHRVRTSAQRFQRLYSDATRPHAIPGRRSGTPARRR